MVNRRLQTTEIDPCYEDAGLFNSAPVNIEVALIPVIHKNNRDDVVVKGLLNGKSEIAVTFAGRRASEAKTVVDRLNALRQDHPPGTNPRNIQLPMQIEGAWRSHFAPDGHGFENRTYHLIAAEWSMIFPNGTPASFGQPPAHLRATTL